MTSRLSPAEAGLLVVAEVVVIAAGFAGLIGPNWRPAGLLAGVVAALVAASLAWSRHALAGPALGAALGLTLAQAYVLATGWNDEELIDPLVVLGGFATLVGVIIGAAIATGALLRPRR